MTDNQLFLLALHIIYVMLKRNFLFNIPYFQVSISTYPLFLTFEGLSILIDNFNLISSVLFKPLEAVIVYHLFSLIPQYGVSVTFTKEKNKINKVGE